MKKWLSNGKQYAEEVKVLKEKERNKPPKKSAELLTLVEHFKSLEDELDSSIYEVTKLTLHINSFGHVCLCLVAYSRDCYGSVSNYPHPHSTHRMNKWACGM